MAIQAKAEDALFLTMDGMRGVGAVLVVMGHSLMFWGALPLQTQITPYLVDMFFLLSGFVIAYAFEPRIARGLSVSGFMLQRVIRLYPIFLVGLLMGLCVHAIAWMDDNVGPGTLALDIVPQFFMIPSLNAKEAAVFSLNNPAWSLFFELWANLLYIVFFRFLSTRVLIGVALVLAVLVVVSSYAYGDMHAGWSKELIWGGPVRACFGFFLGVLLFRWSGSPVAPPRKVTAWAWAPLLAPILIAAIVVPDDLKIPVQLLATFVYGPAVIWIAARIQPPRFLNRLCMRAGALSYGIYMLHFPMFEFFERLAWRHPEILKTTGPWIGVGVLIAVTGLAWIVERYYDEPVRRWIGGKLKQQRARRAAKIMVSAA